jgi:hypothetical protein
MVLDVFETRIVRKPLDQFHRLYFWFCHNRNSPTKAISVPRFPCKLPSGMAAASSRGHILRPQTLMPVADGGVYESNGVHEVFSNSGDHMGCGRQIQISWQRLSTQGGK